MARRILPCLVLLLIALASPSVAQESNSMNMQWNQALRRLKSDDVFERRAAAELIGELVARMRLLSVDAPDTIDADVIIESLLEHIEDRREDAKVRSELMHALSLVGSIPRNVSETLIEIARDETEVPELRSWILMILSDIAPPEMAKPVLVLATTSESTMVRENAYQQLFAVPFTEDELLDLTRRGITDPAAEVRVTAVDGAVELARKDLRAIPLVIRALTDPDRSVQLKAVELVRDLNQGQRAVELALTKLVESEDLGLRVRAAAALMIVSGAAEEYLPILIETLSARDPLIRATAARMLGQLGPRAKEAVEDLERATPDASAYVRVEAAYALTQVTGDVEQSASILVDALRSDDEQAQTMAAGYLALLGARAKPVHPQLLELAATGDADARAIAMSILPSLGVDHSLIIKTAVKALEDEDPHVRLTGLVVLNSTDGLGSEPSVVENVEKLADDANDDVRALARHLLQKIRAADD